MDFKSQYEYNPRLTISNIPPYYMLYGIIKLISCIPVFWILYIFII